MFDTCVRCDSPATIHLTKVVDGKATEVHYCEECAPPLLVSHNPGKEVAKLIKSFEPLASGLVVRRGDPTVTCPDCGMTFAQFKQGGRFGCANDYTSFGPHVDALLGSIHKSTTYTGKVPGGSVEVKGGQIIDDLAIARERLQDAVEREDYEEAARQRDEIRRLAEQARGSAES
jgi:protein arginine kinase activator